MIQDIWTPLAFIFSILERNVLDSSLSRTLVEAEFKLLETFIMNFGPTQLSPLVVMVAPLALLTTSCTATGAPLAYLAISCPTMGTLFIEMASSAPLSYAPPDFCPTSATSKWPLNEVGTTMGSWVSLHSQGGRLQCPPSQPGWKGMTGAQPWKFWGQASFQALQAQMEEEADGGQSVDHDHGWRRQGSHLSWMGQGMWHLWRNQPHIMFSWT